MLLILTSEKDLTADFLIVALLERGISYFRLNAEDIRGAEFTFRIERGTVVKSISVGSRSLDLTEVSAVWYRRVIHPTPAASLAPAERKFVFGELRHTAIGMVLNPDVLWVNPIDKVSIAEHKLYQLQVANKIGLKTPRTIVSRDAALLNEFASANPTGTICKPVFHGLFVDETDSYSVYTRRIEEPLLDEASVKACPVLLQQEIPRLADVRATFIGEKSFVVDISGTADLVDWRDQRTPVTYAVSCLGDETEALCREMLRKLGLVYGAFDFIRAPDGALVFLEVNPTGEWAWLENELGLPMRDAFIDLFLSARA
jgi:glutathione synthase/RimK-type ligase-like ATP-grasp enzyme